MTATLTDTIVEWRSEGLSNKKNRSPFTTTHNFSTNLMLVNN